MIGNKSGFSLIEVIVAIVVLSVGAIAIAASFGTSARFNGQAWRFTRAANIAAQRIETLRRIANTTDPRCSALTNGNATTYGNITETWTVTGAGGARNVMVIVQMPRARSVTRDTVRATLECL